MRTPGKPSEGADKSSAGADLGRGPPPQRSSVDVLLLAAFGPELAPLKPAFTDPASMSGLIGGLAVEARACGIGLATAAAFAGLLLRETKPRVVVLLGTCGVYAEPAPPGGRLPAIGDVIVARRICLVDPSTLLGHAEFPPAMAAPVVAHPRLGSSVARTGVEVVDVATTLAITVNEDAALRIARATGARAEHLEAYGVAVASAACGVPFAAVLGVANVVGSSGRQEWQSHHLRASAAAANVVLTWIEKWAAEGIAALTP
jgi:nucleoside phosphorylase